MVVVFMGCRKSGPKARVIPLELQRLFAQLHLADRVRGRVVVVVIVVAVGGGGGAVPHRQSHSLSTAASQPSPLLLFLLLQRTLPTDDLTAKGFKWESWDGRIQHDVHELNRLLIDALER